MLHYEWSSKTHTNTLKGVGKMNKTQQRIWHWIQFGVNNSEITVEQFKALFKIQRLARAHHRQCENSCNGDGVVKGIYYTTATTEGLSSAYQVPGNDEITVFDQEIYRLETKINDIKVKHFPKAGLEFQYDPRGCTVKLTINGVFVPLQ